MATSKGPDEVSIWAGVSEKQIGIRARSRAISAIDRLFGNIADVVSLPLERSSAKSEARASNEVRLIEAIGDLAVERLGTDAEFASRVLRQEFRSSLRKQKNKDGVLAVALNYLSETATEEKNVPNGPEELNEDFLDKFEAYSEKASSEELQERWGRVLASEILEPGTFSSKVLRVVDELDLEAAKIFENFCKNAVGGFVPIALSGLLGNQDEVALITSDLLVDSGSLGFSLNLTKSQDEAERYVWSLVGEGYALGIVVEDIYVNSGRPVELEYLHSRFGQLRLPVYQLTNAGKALFSIIKNDELDTLRRLGAKLHNQVPQASLYLYELDKSAGNGKARAIETIFESED